MVIRIFAGCKSFWGTIYELHILIVWGQRQPPRPCSPIIIHLPFLRTIFFNLLFSSKVCKYEPQGIRLWKYSAWPCIHGNPFPPHASHMQLITYTCAAFAQEVAISAQSQRWIFPLSPRCPSMRAPWPSRALFCASTAGTTSGTDRQMSDRRIQTGLVCFTSPTTAWKEHRFFAIKDLTTSKLEKIEVVYEQKTLSLMGYGIARWTAKLMAPETVEKKNSSIIPLYSRCAILC